jgi:hypothetical protein
MLATPADIFSIVQATAFALPCFFGGAAWESDLEWTPRWIVIVTCVILAGLLAYATWSSVDSVFLTLASYFGVINIVLGMKACGTIVHNRYRIFGALGVSYTVGLLLGPLGVILLTVPAVLFANRKAASNSW